MDQPSKQVVFGKGLRYLVPAHFESKLIGARAFLKNERSWSEKASNCGIFFDLSKVEWVDISSLLHLVLLVERALADGISVTVAFPLPRPRKSESYWLKNLPTPGAREMLRQRIHKRRRVRQFLQYLRFPEALECHHLHDKKAKISTLQDYDTSLSDGTDQPNFPSESRPPSKQEGMPFDPANYRFFVPLTWLSRKDTTPDYLNIIGKKIAKVFQSPGRGLESIDAESIANVILFEILDNTRHAGSSHALLVAWARPSTTPLVPEHYRDFEKDYIQWLQSWPGPMLEIVMGNSGTSLVDSLGRAFNRIHRDSLKRNEQRDRAVLRWAFDRWSTSDDERERRGTRGLYRLSRVVAKYQGFVSIRSLDQATGLDFGGANYTKDVYDESQLRSLPGTVLKLRIPAYRERTPQRRVEKFEKLKFRHLLINLGGIHANSFRSLHVERIYKELKKIDDPKSECLILTIRGSFIDPNAVAEVLKTVVEVRHPPMIVVAGLPGGRGIISNAVNSVNNEVQRLGLHSGSSTIDAYEVWDPVLVIGEGGEDYWVGVTDEKRAALEALLRNPNGLSLEFLGGTQAESIERRNLLLEICADKALVHRTKDEGTDRIRLKVTPEMIFLEVESAITSALRTTYQDKQAEYMTPTLVPVKAWLQTGQVLDNYFSTELSCLALAAKVRASSSIAGDVTADLLITDAGASKRRIDLLRRYLGIRSVDIVPGETDLPNLTGVQVAPPGSRVLIFSDIVLSAETSRRCISQVLRDNAIPIAVITFLDARKESGEISIWGCQVPLIALASCPLETEFPPDPSSLIPIDPVIRKEGPSRPLSTNEYPVSRDRLLELLAATKSIYMGHVGRPGGRHRTLLLDLENLLGVSELIDPIIDSTQAWLAEGGGAAAEDKLPTIWYPESSTLHTGRMTPLAQRLSRELDLPRDRIQPIPRVSIFGRWVFPDAAVEPLASAGPIILVDQFATSGSSLRQLLWLAAASGASRIKYIALISHLPRDQEQLLRSLRSLAVKKGKPPTRQKELFAVHTAASITEMESVTVPVSVYFVSSASIGVYDTSDCPVCLRLSHLSRSSFALDPDLAAHVDLHEDRLRRQESSEVLTGPARLLDGRELEAESGSWMLRFRHTLERALVSTPARLSIMRDLDRILEKERNSAVGGAEEGLWLLRFLYAEVQWLRRPPLSFKKIRSIVASIAVLVASNIKLDNEDRALAASVLRTASKLVFARSLQTILLSSETPPDDLFYQLILDANTYLDREYHRNISVLEPLLKSLDRVFHAANDGELDLPPAQLSTLRRLLGRVETEYSYLYASTLSRVTAWSKLKSILTNLDKKNHHPIRVNHYDSLIPDQALLQIVRDIRGAAVESERRELGDLGKYRIYFAPWARNLARDWHLVRHFLRAEVLPLVSQILDILQGEDALQYFANRDTRRLVSLAARGADNSDMIISSIISRAESDPSELLANGIWEQYQKDILWLWDNITKPDSNLVKFLRTVPCDAAIVAQEVFGSPLVGPIAKAVQVRLPPELDADDLKVFCPEPLLRFALTHIMDNCSQHRCSERVPAQLDISVESSESHATLVFAAKNTQPTSAGEGELERDREGGLSEIRSRIELFEGSLTWGKERRPSTSHSFVTEISLRRWLP